MITSGDILNVDGQQVKIIQPQAQVKAMYRQLATWLHETLPSDEPVRCIGVLKGGIFTFAGVVEALGEQRPHICIDFVQVASMEGHESTGTAHWLLKLKDRSLAGEQIVIIDDVYDTGLTINAVVDACRELGATAITVVMLADKGKAPHPEGVAFRAGFQVGQNQFLVGPGLNDGDRFRAYPHLGELL